MSLRKKSIGTDIQVPPTVSRTNSIAEFVAVI
jgi:hypothetical protein